MAELILDYPSIEYTSPRLILITIRFIVFNVEYTATIVEPVLDCLVESPFHL
jgi:hypothetical protein